MEPMKGRPMKDWPMRDWPMKDWVRRYRDTAGLRRRVAVLEAEVQECRQMNLRLAELCDVTMELLLPIASRDEERIAEILERYREDVSDPLGGTPAHDPAHG